MQCVTRRRFGAAGGFGRRRVRVGAGGEGMDRALPALPGDVLRGRRLNTLRPLRPGEVFEFVYAVRGGGMFSLTFVVADRRLAEDGVTHIYDLQAGVTAAAGFDATLGVRTRPGRSA